MNTRKKDMSLENTTRARWMLLTRIAVLTATQGAYLGAYIVYYNLHFREEPYIYIILLGTYLLCGLYWVALKFYQVTEPILFLQIFFDIFIISVIIFYTDGIRSPLVSLYLLSIVSSSIFFGMGLTVFFAVEAAVFYAVTILLIIPNLTGTLTGSQHYLNVYLFTLLFFVAALVIGGPIARSMKKKDEALENVYAFLSKAQLDTRDILQNMYGGLITLDPEGRIIFYNLSAERILGYPLTNVAGKYAWDVFEDNNSEFVNLLKKTLSTQEPNKRCEINITDHGGKIKPLGITVSPLFKIQNIPRDMSFRNMRGIIAVFNDLTEEKKVEARLREADRVKAIAELSAGIAHEIRNPIASISGAVEMLGEKLSTSDEKLLRLIKLIEKSSESLQKITLEFLNFARLSSTDMEVLSLREIVDETVSLMLEDPKVNGKVVIENSITDDFHIRFNHNQFTQVLANLILNSVEAIENDCTDTSSDLRESSEHPHGKITISAERVDSPADESENFVRMTIIDNGPGISPSIMDKVFDPFFSTKKTGTGLGLSIVRRIAHLNYSEVFIEKSYEPVTNGAKIIIMIQGGSV